MAAGSSGDALEVGALGWVNVDTREVWVHAEVQRVEESKLTVLCANGDSITVPFCRFLLRDADSLDADVSTFHDLSLLPNLTEPEVLMALERRYSRNCIYTFSGTILLALNPFKVIPKLYDDPRGDYGPHVYQVAAAAHRNMCLHDKDQALLISGESGAGKTETTKFVLRYFASLYGRGGDALVERMVIEANPLLEAFGNAKTLRNDNSSRFGKFIDLKFEEDKLLGSAIRTYLLEKVRVCAQTEGERSFHIFYQVCAAHEQLPASAGGVYTCSSSKHLDWCGTKEGRHSTSDLSVDLSSFGPASSFKYLTIGKLASQDDVAGLNSTLVALEGLNISMIEIEGILAVVAGVLRLGNLGVYESSTEASALVKDAELDKLIHILGVKCGALERALCMKTLRTTDGLIHAPLDIQKAAECRDALARHLYGALFSFICMRINQAFSSLDVAHSTYKESRSIGVLDIFGFEFFEFNSFEQLCINFTNELLQHFFTSLVFLEEEKLYVAEGIPWDAEDFPSNEGVVWMLNARPQGVFNMLDEECRVAQGTDASWVRKLLKSWSTPGKSVYMAAVKTEQDAFVVKHFAGDVKYQSAGFLEKNRDDISKDLMAVMNDSSDPFIQALFQDDIRSFGTSPRKHKGTTKVLKAKQYTVSSEFREQLDSLMASLHQTQPTFVRCIKPNTQNAPNIFDRPNVVEQMRYQGVLQAIAVARAGYPVRWLHQNCVAHLRCLLSPDTRARIEKIPDPRRQSSLVLETLTTTLALPASGHSQLRYAVGATRVFLKQAPYEILERELRRRRRAAATTLQSYWLMVRARRRYQIARRCVVMAQSFVRRVLARWKLVRLRHIRAAGIIQKRWRGFSRRRAFLHTKRAVIRVQAATRCFYQRRRFALHIRSIARIQGALRRAVSRIRNQRQRVAVGRIEHFARIVLARREYRQRAIERFRLRRALRILTRARADRKHKRATRERLMGMYNKKAGTHPPKMPIVSQGSVAASSPISEPVPASSPISEPVPASSPISEPVAASSPISEAAVSSPFPKLDPANPEESMVKFADLPGDTVADTCASTRFQPEWIPDAETISSWSTEEIQMVFRRLINENRILQERLDISEEKCQRFGRIFKSVEREAEEVMKSTVNNEFGLTPEDFLNQTLQDSPISERERSMVACGAQPCEIM